VPFRAIGTLCAVGQRGYRRAAGLRIAACVAIALLLTGIAALGLDAGALDGFQQQAADSVFPRGHVDPRVAVVGIDAHAIAEQGAWPWPRSLQAELVRRIGEAGARVVAVDAVYAPARDGDDALAAALRTTDAVVAAAVELGQPGALGLYRVRSAVGPVEPIAAAAAVGHSAVIPGQDGQVRTVPLVVQEGRHFVPALSLAVLARMRGAPPVVTLRPGGVQVGDRVIPTNDAKELTISYAPAPPVISASDVLAGRVGADELRGKVVFVGVTDLTVGDRVLSPLDDGRGLPGVMTHVMAFNTMLTRAYLAPASRLSVLLWVFFLVLMIALAVQFLPVWVATIVTLAIAAGYVVYAFTRTDHGVVMNFVYPVLALFIAVPASGAVRYFAETRRRRRISRLFAQYVPPAVSQQLVDGTEADELLRGISVRATVLFCDIRGFTALTERLMPPQVRELLDIYYDVMSRVILERDGTVLRYVGDEVYAVFGAPVATDDHAAAALACAGAMHSVRDELNRRLAEAGIPPVAFGIGINTGDLISTVVGSDVRRQYAVIGNSVNLGARLCAQAAAGEIVISQATFDGLPAPPPEYTEYTTQLKGIDGTPTLYRIGAGVPASTGDVSPP
jgi:adenylate cyclase